jgi:hypothetical protein
MAPALYGYLGEFDSAGALTAAARRLRAAGFKHLDAFTPYPVDELSEALGHHWSPVPLLALGGGVGGAAVGFALQWWAEAVAYPIVAGGMPPSLNSWPAFIPITFEMSILGAALTAALAMFVLNRLPQPYHPVFNVPAFTQASQDRFFLLVEARDAHFHASRTRLLLLGLGARQVSDVPE